MIERNVIFHGRGGGKTYTIMTEIHDLIVGQNRRSDVLVIFPNMSYLHWWGREWTNRFPHIPMPRYTSINAMERVRGLRLAKVFVEDIEAIPDGIYSEKLEALYPTFVEADDPEITFTCGYTELGDKFFDDYEPPAYDPTVSVKVKRKMWERLFSGKA